jgi:hypothetical protein
VTREPGNRDAQVQDTGTQEGREEKLREDQQGAQWLGAEAFITKGNRFEIQLCYLLAG